MTILTDEDARVPITRADAIALLQAAIQAGIAVVLWGRPGGGKTSVIKHVVRGLDRPLTTIILAVRDVMDQNGIPKIDKRLLHDPSKAGEIDEHTAIAVTDYAVPAWAFDAKRACVELKQKPVVFFDELNRCQPPVQSSALRIVHERVVGDLQLPDDVSFVAACNTPGTIGTFPLVSAMANRMIHIAWETDVSSWRVGALLGWPLPELLKLPEDWELGVPTKMGLVTSFISTNPELLSKEPATILAAGQAWPSERTWEMVARLLAALDSVGRGPKTSVAIAAVAAAVGHGPARVWGSWIANQDLPDPEEIIADPQKATLPDRQDKVLLTIDAVVVAALSRTGPDGKPRAQADRIKRYRAACSFIGRCATIARDLIIPGAYALSRGMPPEIGNALPREWEEVSEILKKSNVNWGMKR